MTRNEAIAERDRLRSSNPDLLVTIREKEPGEWHVVTGRPRGLTPKGAPLTPEVRAGLRANRNQPMALLRPSGPSAASSPYFARSSVASRALAALERACGSVPRPRHAQRREDRARRWEGVWGV